MRFASWLNEQRQSTLVTSFGRFNPPSIGHEKLINRVQSVARSYNADWTIFISHSNDPKRNPLPPTRKLYWLHKMFPRYKRHIQLDSKVKTFIDIAKMADGMGYDRLIVVAGSDRLKDYQRILDRYNGQDFQFDEIQVVSAGERDPDATDVTGMSASKLRKLAAQGDFEAFAQGVPLNEKDAMALFDELRKEMNLPLDDLEESALAVAGALASWLLIELPYSKKMTGEYFAGVKETLRGLGITVDIKPYLTQPEVQAAMRRGDVDALEQALQPLVVDLSPRQQKMVRKEINKELTLS